MPRRPLLLSLLIVLLGAAGAAVSVGLGAFAAEPKAKATAAPTAKRFNADAAMGLVRMQLSYGQRPAGSPQLRAMAERLRAQLPGGRFEDVPGEPGVRNIVSTVPGRKPAIVVGAHYDTLVKPAGFVGANNGAAGTAIVTQLARTLSRRPRPKNAREVDFVLFDGEEPAAGLPEEQGDFYSSGLRGSRAYVARHGKDTKAMVLLDYVANKGLRLPREANSDSALWSSLRREAKAVGASATFPPGTGASITDDHTPFLRAGIPAIDLIDWTYEGHDVGDTYDKLSTTSADAVGETVLALIQRLRAGR